MKGISQRAELCEAEKRRPGNDRMERDCLLNRGRNDKLIQSSQGASCSLAALYFMHVMCGYRQNIGFPIVFRKSKLVAGDAGM